MTGGKVGILALQGDFALHQKAFRQLGVDCTTVRKVEDLSGIDRLVIPGGEATTIQLLIDRYGLRLPLTEFGRRKPVWGTCAGLILLANSVNDPLIKPLGLIEIEVERNAYGRQVHSFVGTGTVSLDQHTESLEMVFIRAPKIVGYSSEVLLLGRLGDDVTIARQGNILVSTFHPELTDQTVVHEYFLGM